MSQPLSNFDIGFYERVPWGQNAALAVQNILGMSGLFLFPALIGLTFHLPPLQTAQLYGATFVIAGLVTMLQGLVGLRLPVVLGPWAATLAAIIVGGKIAGLGAAFGSFFVAAIIWTILSLPIKKLAFTGYLGVLFQNPLIYGGINMIVITSLVSITLPNWVGTSVQPGFGAANWIGGAVAILVIILTLALARGLLRRGGMLWGIILGAAAYALFVPIHFNAVGTVSWVYIPKIFPFGFAVKGSLVGLFLLMMLTGITNTLALYHLVAEWGGERLDGQRMAWGIFTQSIASVLSAIMGSFSHTVYPDNVGVLKTSRVASIMVTVTAGAVLLVLGFVLKFDMIFVAIPSNVIAAAATLMFGIVLMSVVESLSRIQWDHLNLMVLGLPFMLSLGGLFVSPATIAHYPVIAREFISQPTLTGPLLLLLLHFALNGWVRKDLGAVTAAPLNASVAGGSVVGQQEGM